MGSPSEVIFRYVLRFSDENGFVTWEQRGEIEEVYSTYRPEPGQPAAYVVGEPVYSYKLGRESSPAVVDTTDEPPVSVGWIRRTWRGSRVGGWIRRTWRKVY